MEELASASKNFIEEFIEQDIALTRDQRAVVN